MTASRNARVSVGEDAKASRSYKCPICGQGTQEGGRCFPFCSDRCKTIDLGNWASERYRISRPVEQSDLEEGE